MNPFIMTSIRFLVAFIGCIAGTLHGFSKINHVWLTHKSNDPSRLVINWYSENPGSAHVRYQFGNEQAQQITINENSQLHHVEIPFDRTDGFYYYQVSTGSDTSARYRVQAYPSAKHTLRIAFVGNPGFADVSKLRDVVQHDQPHLLVTLGDNVPDLHQACGEEDPMCFKAYLKFIDAAPEVFATVVLMPILGNHDKQYRDRGTRYPKLPVYDVEASAYRTFFELPDDEWKWHFKLPDFNLCLVALDLNHVGDYGTTWQTSHDFAAGSEQLRWYKKVMNDHRSMDIVTLYNERSEVMRGLADGLWGALVEQGFAAISGFGYYSEYAEKDGFPFFNTSMKEGDQYPDKLSKFMRGTAGYLILTIENMQKRLSLKSFDGTELYRMP